MNNDIAVFWFRRDLRLFDNRGLIQALSSGLPVLPIFIFDTDILSKLDNASDARVHFIHNTIHELDIELKKYGSPLQVFHGKPIDVFRNLVNKYKVSKVYTNHDYEDYGRKRDQEIQQYLQTQNCDFSTCKDIVIFETNEVLKDDGLPYTIFTPYSKKWKARFFSDTQRPVSFDFKKANWAASEVNSIPSLESMGFKPSQINFPASSCADSIILEYAQKRDLPAVHGTSRLGLHLRFGTISVRQLAMKASEISETFLNELIWRDFYHMILHHFPRINQGKSFKPAYDGIQWRNNEEEFEKWCNGNTGYPIVDAGMRELFHTGFMHNRVRMIVASFLCKHLLIDWRWGESWFAKHLLDFDFAANNGGWQWAAGSGCDAAPYFRIFNPYLQTKKFDVNGEYIRKWVPEFDSLTYQQPIVQHEFARARCLEVYKMALQEK
ncbi:MAG: hypothetical protein RIR96_70 [Bacteroidota bacterium]